MWWCCLKFGQKAPGCKFDKHDCREQDDEDEDAEKDADEKEKINKNVKCICCKEFGHPIEECPRDPNIRTNSDP